MSDRLFISYLPDLVIPTHLPNGLAYRYGVELEGLAVPFTLGIEAFEIIGDYEKSLAFRSYANALLQDLRHRTGVKVNLSGEQNFSRWNIGPDTTIKEEGPKALPLEAKSRILCGAKGLREIHQVFLYFHEKRIATNRTCGLHVQLSNEDWMIAKDKCADVKPLEGDALMRFDNVWRAFENNADFFDRLIPPHRNKNKHALRNDVTDDEGRAYYLQTANILEKFASDTDGRRYRYNPRSLTKHGTFEDRGMAAEDYWKPHMMGYIQFTVLFGYEASLNPHVKAEDVMEKHSLKFSNPRRGRINWRPDFAELRT